MNTKHGGPAFPLAVETGPDFYGRKSHVVHEGATLRDYFATAIAPHFMEMAQTLSIHDKLASSDAVRFAATSSYEFADAMLAARGH
jgi:hypothetical protein|nr:hypothetical protein [Brucella anthropi]